jgi:hypothetical protein
VPRFAVLTHDWPAPHWDFLVERGGELAAWRLLAEPGAGEDIPAEPNAPHRLLYLDHEGPVSGDRGAVARWDAGTCEWVSEGPDGVVIELRGQKLVGRAVLRLAGRGAAWSFRLTAPARPG